jgi:SAM-dependent methyltransferase
MSSSAVLYADKATDYFGHARTDIHGLVPEFTSRVLEIGCGDGTTMRWLRGIRQIDHASGIELVPEIAREASSAFDEITVGNIESMALNFAANSFDLIIALDVLEHMVDPWRIVRLCGDLLKPGGVMIASLPNIAHYSVSFALMLRGRWDYESEGLLDRTHLRFFVAQTVTDLLTSSGLVAERVERNVIPPHFINRIPDRFGGRLMRWYAVKLLKHLRPAHLFTYRYLIRVKKLG